MLTKVSIFLISICIGSLLILLIRVLEEEEALALVSIRAQHLIPSLWIKTTWYVTEQQLVVKSVVVVLSQIDQWCFPLHFTPDLLLRHSETWCSVSAQLKQFFIKEYQSAFFDNTDCFTVTGFIYRFITINIVTVLTILFICLIWISTFETFLRAWIYFRISVRTCQSSSILTKSARTVGNLSISKLALVIKSSFR